MSALKPLGAAASCRPIRWSQRLRPKLDASPAPVCSCRQCRICTSAAGSRPPNTSTRLTSEDTAALYTWTPKLVTELGKDRGQLVDVNSDLQQNGLQTYVTIERETAMRYGFAPNQIDNVLYDAFGQRTVSTIFNPFNQYFVVMEVAPQYWQYPQMLDRMYFSTAAGNAERVPRRLRRRAAR